MREGKSAVRCEACGATGHEIEGCRFKHFICSRCTERGHLRRACPRSGVRTKQGQRRVNNLANSQTKGSEESNGASEWEEELNHLSLNILTIIQACKQKAHMVESQLTRK